MNDVYESKEELEEKPTIKEKITRWLNNHPKTKRVITVAAVGVPVTVGTLLVAGKLRSDYETEGDVEVVDFENSDSEPVEVE